MKVLQYLLSMLLAVTITMSCNTRSSDETAADEEAAYAEGEEMADDVENAAEDATEDMEAPVVETIDEADLDTDEPSAEVKVGENDFYYEESGAVVYTFLMEEDRPTFKDGTLPDYIQSNLEYPRAARENESEGTVIVDFIVTSSGAIDNAKVVKPHEDELLNTEALRVVNSMPAWNPGMKDGEAVAYKYSLPIHFVLKD